MKKHVAHAMLNCKLIISRCVSVTSYGCLELDVLDARQQRAGLIIQQ
jgi:hypothetical protein